MVEDEAPPLSTSEVAMLFNELHHEIEPAR